MSEAEKVTEYPGSCACGNVEFVYKYSESKKPIFSVICHCQVCRKANGNSPHLLGVPSDTCEIVKGEDTVKSYDIIEGKLYKKFCTNCGSGIVQGPYGAPFVATYPCNYKVVMENQFPKEGDIPDFMQVQAQINCENAWSHSYVASKNKAPRFKVMGKDPEKEMLKDDE